MRIVIERRHITNAKRKDSHHCMIADAIKDYLGAHYISVDTQAIKFSDPATKERYTYLTPGRAQHEILRWDKGIEVQPFSFELGSPVKTEPLRKTYKGKVSSKKKAWKRYEAKTRKDRTLPRIVKKEKPKVTRFREFGIRKWTSK